MTPAALVYDLDSPRRPGLDDVGGAQKEDDSQYPPDPRTMLTAADWNQVSRLVAGLARVCPLAVLSVAYEGSEPVISHVLAPGSKLSPSSFTVNRRDPGDVEIGWPAGALPTHGAGPTVAINEAHAIFASVELQTNAVRVRTWDRNGSAGDAAFTVCLY